jgi:hypothetical protein
LEFDITDNNRCYDTLAKLVGAKHDYAIPYTWESSYGGSNWSNCAEQLEKLLVCWMRLATNSRSQVFAENNGRCRNALNETVEYLIGYCNGFITVCHNGGKCLTKFLHPRDMTTITHAPGLYLVHDLTRRVYNNEVIDTVQATEPDSEGSDGELESGLPDPFPDGDSSDDSSDE